MKFTRRGFLASIAGGLATLKALSSGKVVATFTGPAGFVHDMDKLTLCGTTVSSYTGGTYRGGVRL